MTTSLISTKKRKITSKKSQVVPSNYHLEEKNYVPMIVLDGETTWGAWCETKEEAELRLSCLEIGVDYHNISTVEEEGTGKEGARRQSERVRIMNELYIKDGRDDINHPMHALFTGLASKNEQISNNNSE
tara:strand:+ start:706 stop:1095 length:390 start_codon:yes stop_codon:yes gene_type:complete